MNYDLLLQGGHLIDPKNNIDAPMDLAIVGGRIAAVDAAIPAAQAARSVDVSGLYITPGLVDIHSHMYGTGGWPNSWAGDNSILPDGFSFRSGVTTMVDTGSTGWRLFPDFRNRVLERFKTRKFAFLNITGLGMVSHPMEQNVADMDVDRAVATMREHDDFIVGTKTAHYGGPEWTSVDRAIAAARQVGMPAMIDFGLFRQERPFYELVTQHMGPGDISTHMFLADIPWIDGHGKVLDYLYEARRRGVLFDVGHGGGSFCWRNAVPAIEQGFYPDTISTDLHTGSMNDAMMDMVTVMSKLLILGMPLEEVIRESTVNPARVIDHEELGHLSVGAVADVAALRVRDGEYRYYDVGDGLMTGKQRIFCELTLQGGVVRWDWDARFAEDWRQLPRHYGVRDPGGLVMPPGTA